MSVARARSYAFCSTGSGPGPVAFLGLGVHRDARCSSCSAWIHPLRAEELGQRHVGGHLVGREAHGPAGRGDGLAGASTRPYHCARVVQR
jgi:hypothetical protein